MFLRSQNPHSLKNVPESDLALKGRTGWLGGKNHQFGLVFSSRFGPQKGPLGPDAER